MLRFFRWIRDTFLSKQLDLRVRLFNILAMAGVLVSLVLAIMNIILKTPLNASADLLGAALSCALLVYTTRTKRYQIAYMITAIGIFLILFPVLFFITGGYRYGMPAFFIFAVAFTIFMLEGRKALLLASLLRVKLS